MQRKIKLLENDLDQAEDRCADLNASLKEKEADNESLTRENKQLEHKVQTLEGKWLVLTVLPELWGDTTKQTQTQTREQQSNFCIKHITR